MADFYKREKSYIRFIQLEPADERTTATGASDHVEFQDLVRLLEYIPERSAEVFRLFAIEGYSHQEIGMRMNISEGTSKWHLSHARERLRSILLHEQHARSTSL